MDACIKIWMHVLLICAVISNLFKILSYEKDVKRLGSCSDTRIVIIGFMR